MQLAFHRSGAVGEMKLSLLPCPPERSLPSRRQFVRVALLGIGAALLPTVWSWRLRPQEAPSTRGEIVLVDGWVLLVDDLAGVRG